MNKIQAYISVFLIGMISCPIFPVYAVEPSGNGLCSSKNATTGGEYRGKVCECLVARQESRARSLKDPICPQGGDQSDQDVAYQVILDIEFSKIDAEIISNLKEFQQVRTKKIVDLNKKISGWFDDTSTDRTYYAKYEAICTQLGNPKNPIGAAVAAFPGKLSTEMFENQCKPLVRSKLSAFREMASVIAVRNVQKSYDNDRREYFTGLRELYQKFLAKWDRYIVGWARIKSKWNIKTKNVY